MADQENFSFLFEFGIKLSCKPAIVPVTKRFKKWLRFNNYENVILLYYCTREENRHFSPVVICERGEGIEPYISDSEILSLEFHEGHTLIKFYDQAEDLYFSLTFSSDRKSDPWGTTISYVEVDPEQFPLDAYMRFRQQIYRAQENNQSRRRCPRLKSRQATLIPV